jgi:UDP-N-acetylglucosamine 1-carboxyvinyltransferase
MAKYLVEGGIPLKGSVKIFGAKNSAFKLMLAASLSDSPSEISNICFIRNVYLVKELLESLGGSVGFSENRTAVVHASSLNKSEVSAELGKESRASAMAIPILLHRFGRAKVPLPGGDSIGARSLDRHYDGLSALGAKVKVTGDFIEVESPQGLVGTTYTFAKNTHTGTETLILAAVLAKGTTVLKNAAQEPEVDDLISFLNSMGARINRIKEREIEIEGVSKLNGARYKVMPDQNEAVTFACSALATKGDILVEEAQIEHLEAFVSKVKEALGGVEEVQNGIRFFYKEPLKATDVTTAPFPGFKTDWQALWTTLMTQASGESVIHETIYESRFAYVEDLKKMGAKIVLFNPPVGNPNEVYNFNLTDVKENSFHAARVVGPTKLHGTNLKVNDIRAGATLTLAALIANGQSVIDEIEFIERGYENLEGRLASLGAKIVKQD